MKLLKKILIVCLALALLSIGCISALSKKSPAPLSNENADALAEAMLTALNKPAFDSLNYLQWEFMMGHKYMWDKQNNVANVQWKDKEVILNLDQVDGKAFVNGQEVEGDKKRKLIDRAWGFWCNDSFWMFAPFKIKDPGTQLSVVEGKEGNKALKVEYVNGGVTPGDTYVWHLDKNNIPTSYQMWVKILPVKGMEVSWEDWIEVDGAKLAQKHGSKMMNFEMKGVRGGASLSDIGTESSSFKY